MKKKNIRNRKTNLRKKGTITRNTIRLRTNLHMEIDIREMYVCYWSWISIFVFVWSAFYANFRWQRAFRVATWQRRWNFSYRILFRQEFLRSIEWAFLLSDHFYVYASVIAFSKRIAESINFLPLMTFNTCSTKRYAIQPVRGRFCCRIYFAKRYKNCNGQSKICQRNFSLIKSIFIAHVM